MSRQIFNLEENPDTICEASHRQLDWKVRDNKLYGVRPFCVIEEYSRNHLALYVPDDRERRIIENKIQSYLQYLLPKHKNYIHQMRENERKLARKNPPVPTKYYGGMDSKPTQVAHTGQIKDTDVYRLAEQCL